MSDAPVLPAIERFADRDALAAAAAEALADKLAAVLSKGARARLAATGGSTPTRAYQILSGAELDWGRVDMTLTDERWVAPSSPDSNERMVRETLLTGPAARAVFHPLWSQAADPETAALRAEEFICARLLPFDATLLGMGEDGHVASLFPGVSLPSRPLSSEGSRVCIGLPAAKPAPLQPRISLTLRGLLLSGLIVLLIQGEAKRRTIERALDGEDLPVRHIVGQDLAPVRILWAA